MELPKPKYLYRGVVVKYDELQDFEFENIDLFVPYEAFIDQHGRKTSHDGNEYGLYMSDNLTMVKDAYSNPEGRGEAIDNKIKFDRNGQEVTIPSIGVTYRIDTENLSIRQPWISRELSGVYNNGYEGDEWIADRVPLSNYSIESVQIGSDLLHKAQSIDVSDVSKIKEQVTSIINERKSRLQLLNNAIEKMPVRRRFQLSRFDIDMKILKKIFEPGGAHETDINSLDTSTVEGMKEYLFVSCYHKATDEIDFPTLRYIDKLNPSRGLESIEELNQFIEKDLQLLIGKRKHFIEEHKEDEEPVSTNYFDRQIEMIEQILEQVKSKSITTGKSTQSLGKETMNEQMETLLKNQVEHSMQSQEKAVEQEQQMDENARQ